MIRRLLLLVVATFVVGVAPASAQSLGTFRWQLQPFGSVISVNVTQVGQVYMLHGREEQCGGNPSLPVYGVAVPQANGSIFFGLTSIMPFGYGLHTEATVFLSNFNGVWRDNANSSGNLLFNPGTTCPGGPRISPIHPDPDATARTLQDLVAEIAVLRARVAAVEGKQ